MKFIQAILILSISIFSSFQNSACTCIGESSTKSALKHSKAVFSGEVLGIESVFIPDSARIKILKAVGANTDSMSLFVLGDYMRKVTLKVETKFKGKFKTDSVSIYTGFGQGNCGFGFEIRKSYIIYAFEKKYTNRKPRPKTKGVYWTNICTRTQEFNQEEMLQLKNIRKPRRI